LARKSRQVETRLLAEYLLKEYKKYPYITKQPLGVVSEELMATEGYKRAIGAMRPFRPEIDAIVILPRYLVLIEAKVWQIMNGLAKLPLYRSLVPVTPELKEYANRKTIMELVVGWTNPNLKLMAASHDIRLKVYCPPWLESVVKDVQHYHTREYQQERQRKLQLREHYGLE